MSVRNLSEVRDKLRREHGGQRILIAEDHRSNREATARLLRIVGLNVEVAADGIEAVAMAASNPYDLIIMDMIMPRMEGLRAAKAIRLLPGYGEVPIIALSGKALEADRDAIIEAGMNGYLAKPTPLDVLFATLLDWLPQTRFSVDSLG